MHGLYTLLISRAGRDNWIGEAIVAQAIHEAMCYMHHHDSISKSSNYNDVYVVLTLTLL